MGVRNQQMVEACGRGKPQVREATPIWDPGLALFGVFGTGPAAKRRRSYCSVGHFLNLALLPAHSRKPGALPTIRLRNYSQRLEDSQCAGLWSRSPRGAVEDYFHEIEIGQEVDRPGRKLTHPAELAIHAYDPANLHRIWDARIELVKDGCGVTESRINVTEFK